MCRGGQYQQYQHQSANNNGRHNNGAQHGQDDSMRSGAGASESSTGAGGGHHGIHGFLRGLGHHGRLLSLRKCWAYCSKAKFQSQRCFHKKRHHIAQSATICIMQNIQKRTTFSQKLEIPQPQPACRSEHKKRYRRTDIRQYRTMPLAFSALSCKIDSEPPRGTRGSGTD